MDHGTTHNRAFSCRGSRGDLPRRDRSRSASPCTSCALRRTHAAHVDGNTAGAIPFCSGGEHPSWRVSPSRRRPNGSSTLPTETGSGKFDVEVAGKLVRAKRVKLLESEHAVADYLAGVAAACRDLIVGTATSSVGLDHMTETVRSLGASGSATS